MQNSKKLAQSSSTKCWFSPACISACSEVKGKCKCRLNSGDFGPAAHLAVTSDRHSLGV